METTTTKALELDFLMKNGDSMTLSLPDYLEDFEEDFDDDFDDYFEDKEE